MGSDALARLWTQAEPRGTDRIVLAVLCDHAGYRDTVAMPVRAIAQAAALSKTATADALFRLVSAGHIKMLDPGGGKATPATYRLTLAGASVIRATRDDDADADTCDAGLPPDPLPEALPQATARDRAAMRPVTLADTMKATSTPVAAPAPAERPRRVDYHVAEGHPHSLTGAILTALGIAPHPHDFSWWRKAHQYDADELARIAGGEKELLDILRRRAAYAPRDFRNLGALKDLVREGRG